MEKLLSKILSEPPKKPHWRTEFALVRRFFMMTVPWKTALKDRKVLLKKYYDIIHEAKRQFQPKPIIKKTQEYTELRYNFNPLNDSITSFRQVVQSIRGSGRLNIRYNYVVLNRETGERRTYEQQLHNVYFTRRDQVYEGLNKMEQRRAQEQVQRPSTKWTFEKSRSLTIKIIPDGQPLLGRGELPDWVTHINGVKNRSIIPLTNFDDDLCNWRCFELATGKYPNGYMPERLTRRAQGMCHDYHEKMNIKDRRQTLTIQEYSNVEDYLQRPIMVYEPRKMGDTVEWLLRRTGAPGYEKPIFIGNYNDHSFLIKDVFKMTKRIQCANCGQQFMHKKNLVSHRCNSGKTQIECPNIKLEHTQTLSQKVFNKKHQAFPYFIVWDIECILKRFADLDTAESGEFAQHIPISCSISDNLSNQEKCIVSRSPAELVDEMLKEMLIRQGKITQAAIEHFATSVKGEDILRLVFELLTGKTFKKMRSSDSGLEWDGYNAGLKVALEFNGQQHYSFNKFFHGTQERFRAQQERDKCKHAEARRKGVSLFTCSSVDSVPDLIERVHSFLERNTKANLTNLDCKTTADLLRLMVVSDNTGCTDLHQYLTCVPVLGFNSGKYDLNAVKESVVKNFEGATVAKNGNKFMYIKTKNLHFLDVYNYLAPNYSLDNFIKAYRCKHQKSYFPYEWFDSYEKLNYPKLPPHKAWFSSLKNTNIPEEEYIKCKAVFREKKMTKFEDWLRYYNGLDTIPLVEAVRKMCVQYHKQNIDILKDCCSISGLAMKFLINTSLQKGADLHSPSKKTFDILQQALVGGPSIIFKRYAERNTTTIRYGGQKPCKKILGFDANALYLWCLAQVMPGGRDTELNVCNKTASELSNEVLNDRLFGFAVCDIKVPAHLSEKFSEMSPIFTNVEIPDHALPHHLLDYLAKSGRKRDPKTRKLCGVMSAEQIPLYTPLLKWYLEHGLEVSKYHSFISYEKEHCFKWFSDWVSDERRKGDNNPDSQIAADTAKLCGNSGYGKLIENLSKQTKTVYTNDKEKIRRFKRSALLHDIEQIGDTFEIDMHKKSVTINRPYQCGIAVYQLAKLRMLQFYYDFMDKYCDRSDFEYLEMDTDSAYMAISGETLEDIIRPDMWAQYEKVKNEWFVHDKYSKRTPGLFKLEFAGDRMVNLCSKCYYVEDDREEKLSCKGVQRNKNTMTFQRYKLALDDYLGKGNNLQHCKNIGFKCKEGKIVSYQQQKIGLSAAYDKRYVLEDGIHTSPLNI